MAEDYKLAPVLDDGTNYIDWCKELDVWVGLTEPPEKDLKVWRGGFIKSKEKLDKAFSKGKKKATYDAYEKFERFNYSKEMSLNLPPVVKGYQYLNSANLTEV